MPTCFRILRLLSLLALIFTDPSRSLFQDGGAPITGRKCPKIEVIRRLQGCEVNCNCPYNYERVLRCDGDCEHADIVPEVLQRLRASNASMLDLSIRRLPKLVTGGAFQDMQSPPSGLVISTNGALSEIVPSAFKGLERSLITLSLVGNSLEALPSSLASLFRLQTLDISRNSLRSLFVRKKNGLGGLRSLDVESNLLSHMIFQTQMKNLETLILRNNSLDSERLSYLMESVGIHLSKVEFINLAGNAIQGSLTPSHFPVSVDSLHYLDLSENDIADILPGTFSHLPNLKSLNLQRNFLDVIRPGSFIGLKRLNILDLSQNEIRVLHRENSELLTLSSFDVSNNRISLLNENFAIKTIKNLNLSYNLIKSVEVNSLESLENISVLSVSNNPLNCNCELHYFQSWLSEHESLNRQSRNSAICKTPHGFSGEELLSIIKLSSTCDNSKFDYLDEEAEEETSPEEDIISVSQGTDGLIHLTLNKASYKCDRLSVFDSRPQDGLEIYSKPLRPMDCLQGNASFSIYPEAARIDRGRPYSFCMTLRHTDSSASLLQICSSPFSLQRALEPRIERFSARILSSGVLELSYNVSSLSSEGPCGLWILVQREAQTLKSRLLSCSSSEEVLSGLPIYPEYRVCYSLRMSEFKSGDKSEACIDAREEGFIPRANGSKSALLPLTLTLIFLAVGTAALVVLYFIIKGYISDRRNASLFHRSGLKPPLSDFFECLKRATRGRSGACGSSRPSSSALYLNGGDEESNQEDFEF